MDFGSMSGIVLALALVVAIVALVPLATRRGMMNAAEHDDDRFSPSLHIVDVDVPNEERAEGHDDRDGKEACTMKEATHSLSQDHIRRVRANRKKAVRRRQIIVSLLSAATVVFAILGISTPAPWWIFFIPLTLLAVVLGLGARASARTRDWEKSLRAGHMTPSSVSSDDPEAYLTSSSSPVSPSDFTSQVAQALIKSEEPEEKTDTMSRVEIQETLTLAVREKAAANRKKAKKAMEDLRQQSMAASISTTAMPVQTSSDEPSLVAEAEKILGKGASGDDTIAVSSREIISHRQVARAVPPSQPVPIPASDMAVPVDAPTGSEDSLGVDAFVLLDRR